MAEEDALLAFQHECGVCGLIPNGMSDSLFDIYQNVDSSKELCDSLEAKYMAEDASSKKFLISNFTNYKMTNSRLVMQQYNEILGILGRFTQHKRSMDEAIQVSCIIDKLPPSWKDFKHTLKHNKEESTLVELGSYLRIKESLKAQDSDKPKGNNVTGPSVVNMVELNNSFRMMMLRGGLTQEQLCMCVKIDAGTRHFESLNTSHVHFKRMQDIPKDGLIPAFDMDTKKCKTCMLTKITKKPFQNVKRETKVLEQIHSDLCDLYATPSLGNKKYFVTFIDDASRTDRGGEFMDTLYFQSVGIIHETTTPYTRQQNGISERKNIVLNEMVNSMLSYLGLSQRAFVKLPDLKLKTLGERGIECIFVGYAEHSKAFRFYVIEHNELVSINSIIESRDAIFDENRFSSVPRPRQRSLINRIEDIGGSVVLEEVTEEVVIQQPEPELRKSKRNRIPKNIGPEFQLYLRVKYIFGPCGLVRFSLFVQNSKTFWF
ncbi:zinc finger, CCHC-type containing protein [Tanacetum coccineum]